MPTCYPGGGAKQLIRVLTGKEVPAGKRSTDIGVQCFNVATAYTRLARHRTRRAADLAHRHRDRQRRTRRATARCCSARRSHDLVALGRPTSRTPTGYIMGGPMMGFALPGLTLPVVKATNCILAARRSCSRRRRRRCPASAAAPAPKSARPSCSRIELYWFARARNFGKAQEYNLFDCIECGCCSYVCPSHIPLVQYYRFAKSEIWSREREKNMADAAKARFELRNEREEREKAEKAARPPRRQPRRRPRSRRDARQRTGAVAVDAEGPKKAAIAAAIERAQVQREAAQPKNTEA